MEEGLGLARAGAGGDDGRFGAVAALGGQAAVGVLLVLVGGQARIPVEGAVGGGGGLVGRAGPAGPDVSAGLDGASGRAGLAGLASPTGANGAGARGQVGQAQAHEGADEDALLLVLEEVGEHPPRLGVREREGRRQVVDDGSPDAFGLEAGEEESHDWGALVVGDGGSDAVRERCPPGRRARRGFVRIVVAPGQGSRRSEATAGASRTSCFLMTRRACSRASPILGAMLDLSVTAACRCGRCCRRHLHQPWAVFPRPLRPSRRRRD